MTQGHSEPLKYHYATKLTDDKTVEHTHILDLFYQSKIASVYILQDLIIHFKLTDA